ncbi:MAG: lytic transglycosylase domain-containing protein, partial [Alphaproteobacteria bacterium]
MDSSAADILSRFQGTRPMPERWSLEARILARRALEDGHYSEAAKLVAKHGLKGGGEFAEAEFLAGWIHLRFLKDPNAAEDHFKTLFNGVSYPISRSRGAYWKARAVKAR